MAKMMKLETLDRKLRDAKRQVRSIEKERIRTIRKMALACPRCGSKNPIGRFTFVQVYIYEPPHGHAEGDTHHPRDSMYCDLICPECGSAFRIMDSERALAIEREWNARGISPSMLFPKRAEADLGPRGILTMRKPMESAYVH